MINILLYSSNWTSVIWLFSIQVLINQKKGIILNLYIMTKWLLHLLKSELCWSLTNHDSRYHIHYLFNWTNLLNNLISIPILNTTYDNTPLLKDTIKHYIYKTVQNWFDNSYLQTEITYTYVNTFNITKIKYYKFMEHRQWNKTCVIWYFQIVSLMILTFHHSVILILH